MEWCVYMWPCMRELIHTNFFVKQKLGYELLVCPWNLFSYDVYVAYINKHSNVHSNLTALHFACTYDWECVCVCMIDPYRKTHLQSNVKKFFFAFSSSDALLLTNKIVEIKSCSGMAHMPYTTLNAQNCVNNNLNKSAQKCSQDIFCLWHAKAIKKQFELVKKLKRS